MNIKDIDLILGPDEDYSGLACDSKRKNGVEGKKPKREDLPRLRKDQAGSILSSKADEKYGIRKKLEAFKKDFSLF